MSPENDHSQPDLRHANRTQPKHAMIRQWAMLKLIPREPAGITVQEIKLKLAVASPPYEVHRRTIERNLMQLMSIFPELDYCEDTRGNQWHWERNTVVDMTSLKEPESDYLATPAPPTEPKDAILRQWLMLKIIARDRSGLTSRQIQLQLAETDRLYTVHHRTIERNLRQLREIFPELNCRGDGNSPLWHWTKSPHGDIPDISETGNPLSV